MTIGYLVFVGRVIGPAEYSDFSAALSIIYFVGLTLSPLTPTIARLTASYRARGGADDSVVALRRAALQRTMLVAGAITVAGIAVSFALANALRFRTAAPLAWAFAAVFLYAIVSVDRGVAQGLLLFRFYNANVIIEAAVRLVLAVILVLIVRAASSALLPYVVGLGIAEIALAGRLRQRGSGQGSVDWLDVRRLAVPIMIVMFSLAVFQNADMLAVKRWFSPRDAGAYGAATAVARAFGVIFVPFYVIAGPLLTSLHEAGKPIVGATLRLTAWFAAAGIAALLLVAAAPQLLLRSLYGADFLRGASILVPLGGIAIISYAGLMLAQALLTLHDFRFVAGYVVCAVLQCIGLAFFHTDYSDVIRVLYVAQIAAVLSVSIFFLARRRA